MGSRSILVLAVLVSISAASFGADLSLTPSSLNTKSVGEKFSVTCTKGQDASATGSSDDDRGMLKWYKVEGAIEKEMTEVGNVRTVSTSDPNRSLLMFDNGTESESGEYKCKYGQDSVSIKITIQAALVFVDTPREQNPMIGEDATIKCGTSYPDAVISWTKSGQPLATNGATRYSIDNKTNGLIISAYRGKEDDGEYVCQAIHMDTGKTIDRGINVVGHRSPSISSSTDRTIRAGFTRPSEMFCESFAVPAPSWKWYRNGQLIVRTAGYVEVKETNGTDANHYVSRLTVIPQGDYDFGTYKCEASNAIEPVGSKSIEMIKIAPGMPVIATTSAESNTIQCNTTQMCPITWSLDDTGGRRVTRQEVQYRPVAKPGETEAQFLSENIGGDETQFVLKNLAPKTTYELRIRAFNGEMGPDAVVYVITPVSHLNEVCMWKGWKTPIYGTLGLLGDLWLVRCLFGPSIQSACGAGKTVKEAKFNAAEIMIDSLRNCSDAFLDERMPKASYEGAKAKMAKKGKTIQARCLCQYP